MTSHRLRPLSLLALVLAFTASSLAHASEDCPDLQGTFTCSGTAFEADGFLGFHHIGWSKAFGALERRRWDGANWYFEMRDYSFSREEQLETTWTDEWSNEVIGGTRVYRLNGSAMPGVKCEHGKLVLDALENELERWEWKRRGSRKIVERKRMVNADSLGGVTVRITCKKKE